MEKEAFMINNKSITELRVVDLKKELEKRKLSKSGSKTELIKRLKNVGYPFITLAAILSVLSLVNNLQTFFRI